MSTMVTEWIRKLRASARRGGAEQSGLASLTELSLVNAAGDALVTVALAGSLFFAVPTGEARSKVALYLLITMVPFALLAPVTGPILDRFAYGRRTALAAICLGRGMLAWQLASSLDSVAVYPLALGLLMLSRSFGVARSAVVPRVTPRATTLVKVNSRISLVNIAAGSVVAPLGLAVAIIPYVGYPWVLRICAVVYMVGVLLAFNLPKHVDSAAGEKRAFVLGAIFTHRDIAGRLRRALGGLPVALRASLVLRGLVGFLTFYLAFLLRATGGNNLWLAGLAICAGAGSGLGVFVGGRLGRRRPEALLMMSLLMAAGGCIGAAVTYTKVTSLLAALLVTMASSMGKLGLDAIIQRDVVEDTRNSAFARSETTLQLAWVAGGAFGLIEMPGTVGFAVASGAVLLTMFIEARALRRSRAAAQIRRSQARPDRAVTGGPAAVGDTAAVSDTAVIGDTAPIGETAARRDRVRTDGPDLVGRFGPVVAHLDPGPSGEALPGQQVLPPGADDPDPDLVGRSPSPFDRKPVDRIWPAGPDPAGRAVAPGGQDDIALPPTVPQAPRPRQRDRPRRPRLDPPVGS